MEAERIAETTTGQMVANHALQYVQGKDVGDLVSFTLDFMMPLDNCENCQGAKGGTLGNENIMPDGRILCDFCTAEELNPVVKFLEEGDSSPTIYFEQETGALVPTDELVQILPKENEDVPREESNPRHYPEGD